VTIARRKKVVVLGITSTMPVPGVIWLVAQYLIGFERLGFEAYYVEAHGIATSRVIRKHGENGQRKACEFIAEMMKGFGLSDRWAYHARYKNQYFGMSAGQLGELYRSAALIINLHGGTKPRQAHGETGRLVYLETDPVGLEIRLHNKDASALEMLESHAAFFTWGLNYGQTDCQVPLDPRFPFRPTCPPVILDFWEGQANGPGGLFTTVGNWRQKGAATYEGETYHWSKDREFRKFLDLPERIGPRFELALNRDTRTDEDVSLLTRHGWRVRNGFESPSEVDAYRQYICDSRGELTVAKDQNVRLRSGWFSERSACYLAAGRPVVTQDTGFGRALPVGAGLFSFTTTEDIVAAVGEIEGDYDRHSRAARSLAEEHFRAERVLSRMLRDLDV
jgi:hypothetical protein